MRWLGMVVWWHGNGMVQCPNSLNGRKGKGAESVAAKNKVSKKGVVPGHSEW